MLVFINIKRSEVSDAVVVGVVLLGEVVAVNEKKRAVVDDNEAADAQVTITDKVLAFTNRGANTTSGDGEDVVAGNLLLLQEAGEVIVARVGRQAFVDLNGLVSEVIVEDKLVQFSVQRITIVPDGIEGQDLAVIGKEAERGLKLFTRRLAVAALGREIEVTLLFHGLSAALACGQERIGLHTLSGIDISRGVFRSRNRDSYAFQEFLIK